MRVWYFSEMAYHPAWEEGLKRGSLRVVLPNANYDPEIGHRLLNRYLDEFRLCDEVGLDIMVNEHHSTSTCLTISVPMALAVIARETKRARLLSLGTPIANRPDPVRVAEEMAWLDVLSGGRLEMGLVKGAPYEIAPANSNPANLMRRYWEAHDLILKAMSTTDGPFSWEGEFFHYRNVNIWPRPYQQPTPPVWMTGLSPETGRMAAERGHVVGTLLSLSAAGPMFDAIASARRSSAGPPGPTASPMPAWSASARRARRGCAAPISRPTMFGLRWSWPRHSQTRRATTRSPPISRCSNPAESAAALFGTATATRSTRGPRRSSSCSRAVPASPVRRMTCTTRSRRSATVSAASAIS